MRVLRDALLALAAALAVLALAVALLTARVEGVSMLPTFHDGDALLVDRVGVHLRPPGRGDVVIVLQPNGVPAVKRVIGVPGDEVEIDGAHVDAPGLRPRPAVLVRPGGGGVWQRLDEPYVPRDWLRPDFCCDGQGRLTGTGAPHPVSLAPDEFFVLGDNRGVSKDSRTFGLVTRDRIVGRVVARYWPLQRAGAPASGLALLPA